MKLKVHTIDQPDSDTTAFFLSCNRLHLLEQTFYSFLRTRDYLTKIVIVDDSGIEGIFEYLVAKYGQLADVICFPTNRGLWWAKDFMVSFCDTEYIFYVEEDWKFIQSGYLNKSKQILKDYRHIGSIDISWRTFAEEGFDSYETNLQEAGFYYKKPWRISPNHLHWFIWQGSPNLKRREDLILLGRVEQFYNEWNIDRKYYAMGYKGVYLDGRYVIHLGDHESIMVNKRNHEHTTPETLYPEVLKMDRLLPSFDYYALDQHAINYNSNMPSKQHKVTLVTSMLDIGRSLIDGRDFIGHYLEGLRKLIQTKYPIVVYADKRYYEEVLVMTGGKDCLIIPYDLDMIYYDIKYSELIQNIVRSEEWVNQADWIKTSVLKDPNYILLTLHKIWLLYASAVRFNHFRTDQYYWIDCGICKSFNIDNISDLNLDDLSDKINISSFDYFVNSEIHGFSREGYNRLYGSMPTNVPRATLFGGNRESISILFELFQNIISKSVSNNYIGTEESIFCQAILDIPELFDIFKMPSGDISYFVSYLNRKI